MSGIIFKNTDRIPSENVPSTIFVAFAILKRFGVYDYEEQTPSKYLVGSGYTHFYNMPQKGTSIGDLDFIFRCNTTESIEIQLRKIVRKFKDAGVECTDRYTASGFISFPVWNSESNKVYQVDLNGVHNLDWGRFSFTQNRKAYCSATTRNEFFFVLASMLTSEYVTDRLGCKLIEPGQVSRFFYSLREGLIKGVYENYSVTDCRLLKKKDATALYSALSCREFLDPNFFLSLFFSVAVRPEDTMNADNLMGLIDSGCLRKEFDKDYLMSTVRGNLAKKGFIL